MPETLKRASIRTIEPAGDPFDVLFNPNQYRLSKSNQFSEFSTPGGGAPLLQFGHGSAQTLTLQLFFDTYDRQARIARASFISKSSTQAESSRTAWAPATVSSDST